MESPYKLPEGNVQIGFSGGRSSAYLLHQIIEENGPLPDRVVVTFDNTGREREEALRFVDRVGTALNVNIFWLEYSLTVDGNKAKPSYRVVNFDTASRSGEPFETLINHIGYLPNQKSRFCTIELKVRTTKRFLLDLGWEHWTNAVGLRADEPARLNKPPPPERWTVWHPMAEANVSKHDVAKFWASQPFDLELPNINGKTPDGNCDGCFLKSEAYLARLSLDHPHLHEWWERMERTTALRNPGNGAHWSLRYTRAELRDFMERQGDFAMSTEGALCQADGGECV